MLGSLRLISFNTERLLHLLTCRATCLTAQTYILFYCKWSLPDFPRARNSKHPPLQPTHLHPNVTGQLLKPLYMYSTLASRLPLLFHVRGHASPWTVPVHPLDPQLPCCTIKTTTHPDKPGQSCHSFGSRQLYLSR